MWGGATAGDAPAHIPQCANLLMERFTRRVAMRTGQVRSGCPVRHRGTLPVLNIWRRPPQGGEPGAPRLEWQHLLVCLSADPSCTSIRLRQANFQDEDIQEQNPGYVPGARGRCGDTRRKGTVADRTPLMSFISPEGSVSVSGGIESWRSLPRHRRRRPMSVLPVVPHEEFERTFVTGMCSTIIARSVTSRAPVPRIM